MAYIPYGYKVIDGKAVIDPVEQERLMTFFRLYLEGCPLRDCQRESGLPRSYQGAELLISKRQYLGTDFYPAMISEELFDSLQKELQRRKEARKPHVMQRRIIPIPVYTAFSYSPPSSTDPTLLYNSIKPEIAGANIKLLEEKTILAEAGQKGESECQ